MKITLNPAQFVFNPTAKTVNFDNMGGTFVPERLLAVINVTTGLVIYSTASAPNYGGTFSNGTYTKSILTYTSTNVGQSASDILQILYDSDSASQFVSGTVSSLTQDSAGNGIGSVVDPLGGNKLKTASSTLAGDGTPILSTPDPISGTDSLNTHLQSSSFGGQVGSPIPLPNHLNALSVGFLNSGVLVSPAMDPVSNQLIVQSAGVPLQDVNITSVDGTAISGPNIPIDIVSQSGVNLETNINLGGVTPDTNTGVSTSQTLRVSSNLAFAGTAAQTGAGTTNTGTQRVVIATDQSSLPTTTNLTQYGGASTSLGQKAMSASIPVVVSSDQSTLNTSLPDLYITGALNGAAGNNNLLASAGPGELDVSGYKSAAVQVISTATSGTYIFEGSNSTTSSTFQPIPAFRLDSVSPNAIVTAITATATNLIYIIPVRFRYMRMRVVTGLSTPIQALTRLSQDPFVAPVVNVVNATGSNLNAVISGSLTSAGTVSTVSTVTTVASMTSGNLGIPGIIADVSSAAITTTTTTGALTPTFGPSYQVVIPVTVVSGTNPTLDISIEESDDTGTNWVRVYDFPRITAIGVYRSGPLKLRGNRIRYVQTIGGTGPSFTRSIGRLQRSDTIFSRLGMIDRTINPNTLNSTSAVLFCDGTSEFNFYARCTAQTTAATIQIQFSDDNVNWYSPASATLTTAVGFVKGQITDEYWRFARAIVTAAGTGITFGELSIKAARE